MPVIDSTFPESDDDWIKLMRSDVEKEKNDFMIGSNKEMEEANFANFHFCCEFE